MRIECRMQQRMNKRWSEKAQIQLGVHLLLSTEFVRIKALVVGKRARHGQKESLLGIRSNQSGMESLERL